jgi:hypothetical protein
MSEALRKAAEQALSDLRMYVQTDNGTFFDNACSTLEAALAEPEQSEPVAWMHEDELPESYPYDLMYPHSKVDGVRMFPVFAAPPRREPLSDKTLWEMWVESPSDVLRFARAIEQAHGITGGKT